MSARRFTCAPQMIHPTTAIKINKKMKFIVLAVPRPAKSE